MEVFIHSDHTIKKCLTNDYIPNPAMKNVFHSTFLKCSMCHIELIGQNLQGYHVQTNAQFIALHMKFKNISNTNYQWVKDDFQIYFDDQGPFLPEDYFEVENQFQNEYMLEANQEIKGSLIFIISNSAKKIKFEYEEIFDMDEYPKVYRMKYVLPAFRQI